MELVVATQKLLASVHGYAMQWVHIPRDNNHWADWLRRQELAAEANVKLSYLVETLPTDVRDSTLEPPPPKIGPTG